MTGAVAMPGGAALAAIPAKQRDAGMTRPLALTRPTDGHRAPGLFLCCLRTRRPPANARAYVRYRIKTGKHILTLRISGFDPTRTPSVHRSIQDNVDLCGGGVRRRGAILVTTATVDMMEL
jgi:hypothetical protein